MKKIILTTALLALVVTAKAQFVVSAQLGGSYAMGATTPTATYHGHTSSGADSIATIPTDTITHDNPLNLTGGIKLGYQTGRIQFGIAASYSFGRTRCDMKPDEFNQNRILPDHENPLQPNNNNVDYEGWYIQRRSSFTVAPYFRFEAIQMGDVAFFLELNAYYSKTFQPIRRDYADWYWGDMHNTIDTTYHIMDSSQSYGAKIIPGLSWQLSPNCYIDLYFDLMALSLDKTIQKIKETKDEYIFTSGSPTLAKRTITHTTRSDLHIGYIANGINSISPSDRNWVRIGINYTF